MGIQWWAVAKYLFETCSAEVSPYLKMSLTRLINDLVSA